MNYLHDPKGVLWDFYKDEVKKHFPNADYFWTRALAYVVIIPLGNPSGIECHITLPDDYPLTYPYILGVRRRYPQTAWKSAYLALKKLEESE